MPDPTNILLTTGNPALQLYGLIFLLGSLTVSSLSDLRRLAAQKDFSEVWGAFTALLLLADILLAINDQSSLPPIAAKWILILITLIATTNARLFNISTMDVTAITALLSLLNPLEIIASLTLLAITAELLQPILKSFGKAGAYPFLPIVLAVNVVLLAYLLAGGPQLITETI